MMSNDKTFASVMKHDISARDFYDAIVLALGEKGGFKPSRPIAHSDTYEPVLNHMGITRDQYGKQDNTGAWWVERWMQEAFKGLVNKGLAVRPSRGMWALTPAGVAEAQRLATSGIAPVTPSAPAAQEEDDDMAPATSAAPAKKTAPPVADTGVSLPVSGGGEETGYHPDPYVRALGIQTSTCIGLFSTQAPKCGSCPIQVSCINSMAAELSRLALDLASEDRAAELAKAQPKPPASKPASAKPASGTSPASTSTATPAASGTAPAGPATDIRCQQQAICAKCGGTMPKGTPAKWVRANDGGQPGIYHPACFGT